ncbi:MAG: Fe(3+) ABC transporter substrate-binding protein [Gammaproteobacteria bacterium]|nr:Fe(3+) ABC transporter substrate-binding protein [Gammaproteobacteria bacterium]|tara:strand:+ start:1576 stop:2589 length:1014 start_codon:yes stop_codon:yes gene_type:complete
MALARYFTGILSAVLSLSLAAAEVNLYSSRKDILIVPLLEQFEEQTGIEVNLITGKASALMSRIKSEGEVSPADLLITVDAGNLHRAKAEGLVQVIQSELLESAIPEVLRDPQMHWVGLTRRARTIFYAEDRVDPKLLSTYENLVDDEWEGRICIRSSSNIYNQSLVASLIEVHGEDATEAWAKGIVANMARKPTGGDTDQLRAVAAGQCDLAISNTYYYGRLLDSERANDKKVVDTVKVFWLNQNDRGAHVNISGAAIAKYAPNYDEAIKLLEFMVSEEVQSYYAEVNHEFPVVGSATVSATIQSLGTFKSHDLNLSILGKNNKSAVMIMDRANWQ